MIQEFLKVRRAHMTGSNPYRYLCSARDSREIYLESLPLLQTDSREESVSSAEQHRSSVPRASLPCPDMESLKPRRTSIQDQRFETARQALDQAFDVDRVLRILDAERKMRESKFDLTQSDRDSRHWKKQRIIWKKLKKYHLDHLEKPFGKNNS